MLQMALRQLKEFSENFCIYLLLSFEQTGTKEGKAGTKEESRKEREIQRKRQIGTSLSHIGAGLRF